MSPSRELWRPAYIGIGSNLGRPIERVLHAFAAIAGLPDNGYFLKSGLYCSAPMGSPDQPDFVNAVAAVLTRMEPHDLLRRLQRIEASEGRLRQSDQWGPRTLDLDLLVVGRLIVDDDVLRLPHPRIAERNFVLLPLADVAPYLFVPGLGTVTWLLSKISTTEPRIEAISPERFEA